MESVLEIKERPKLTIVEQVEYMRDKKGIKFEIVSEDEAVEFLTTHSYYFKLKAYEKNYPLKKVPEEQYYGLEFAYLQELSKLDAFLRKIILDMTLDIEHFLKVKIMETISNDKNEDGYTIVNDFLNYYPSIKTEIERKTDGKTSYVSDLIGKYIDKLPVWVLFEIISFGQFITFCEYYQTRNPKIELRINNVRTVKYLRNAAAHNNCLINNLGKQENFQQSREANSFVQKIKNISVKTQNKKMGNRFMHDFVTMLVVFDKIVTSEETKKVQFYKLKNLVDTRFTKHKEYFKNNEMLLSNYEFAKKIIDKLYENAYNNDEAQKNFK